MRRLLLLGGFALLLVFAIVVVASLQETRAVTASLEEVRTRLRPRAEAAYEIEIDVYEVSSAVLGYMADPDTIKLRSFNQARGALDTVALAYARLSNAEGTKAPFIVRRLRKEIATYDSASTQLVNQRAHGGFSSIALERAARARYRGLRDKLDTLLDQNIQPAAIQEWHARAGAAQTASEKQARVVLAVAALGLGIVILAFTLTARAYTALDAARERAELSSRQKTEFASLTAHELRSPLTSILGSLRLLKSGRAGALPENAIQYLEMSSRSTAEILGLINDLLELDRIEAGMLPFAKGPVDCTELLRVSRDSLLGMAEELDLTVTADCKTSRPLLGDPVRLRQVLVNLISNAIKHAPRETEVTVWAEDRDSRVRISVRDRGPGVAPQDRERVFQRFVQTGSAPPRFASTGLGLAIAREIVERHDGQIGVESELGEGATLWFEIPAAAGAS
ncbi:MAG TPA: HAMP domain-containing sensor histidine kinase [Gemmatimonadaceae bacterium]